MCGYIDFILCRPVVHQFSGQFPGIMETRTPSTRLGTLPSASQTHCAEHILRESPHLPIAPIKILAELQLIEILVLLL
jgi:hypothetical protein